MNSTGMSRKTEEDIKRISYAMDALAKLIIEKRHDGTQEQIEYQLKLKKLNTLIELILGMKRDEFGPRYELDSAQLDRLLRNEVEVIEKTIEGYGDNGQTRIQRFALIPITTQHQRDEPNINKKSKKKKKNKICCSFCNETGHTRAKCDKKLLYSKE